MPNIEMVHDIVESNGKTIKENNLKLEHSVELGKLIEIITWDEESKENYGGIRLFVTNHTRDCDGTPLYTLGSRRNLVTSNLGSEYGFTREMLKVLDV